MILIRKLAEFIKSFLKNHAMCKRSSHNSKFFSPDIVWAKFGSWLRTIRPGIPPSEYVTSLALRNSFPDFLSCSTSTATFTKFLFDRIDFKKNKARQLAA